MSYQPGDELLDGAVSNCCGARVIENGRCNECKEGCGTEKENVIQEIAEFEANRREGK